MAEIINEPQGVAGPVVAGPVITEHMGEKPTATDELRIYSHSPIFYWWPVWFFGFIMAGITWFFGDTVLLDSGFGVKIHKSSLLGLSYTLILFLVFLVTNMSLRGLISGMVIMFGAFIIVLFAWLGWWDDILFLIPDVHVYMNLGFYMMISVLTLGAWILAFFVFDRMDFYRVVPGQVTVEHLIGGGEKSHDSGTVIFEQLHTDFFKHNLLGLGAGDLKLTAGGAGGASYYIPNVLFADYKVKKIQELIKRKPE